MSEVGAVEEAREGSEGRLKELVRAALVVPDVELLLDADTTM